MTCASARNRSPDQNPNRSPYPKTLPDPDPNCSTQLACYAHLKAVFSNDTEMDTSRVIPLLDEMLT